MVAKVSRDAPAFAWMWSMTHEQETQDVDPVISEAVETVSNRFGAQGLCDLIALAREELARAEAALKELAPAGE